MNTEILLDHEPVADGGYVVRALLRVTGEAPESTDRPGLNLAVVLDRSGSMAAMRKLERAKAAAALLVRRIGDDDTVSLVAYDDAVRTLAGPTAGRRRDELLARLARVETGGTTNLSGGWLRGRELVAEGLDDRGERAVDRVLLLTDGLANVGITDPGRLRDLVASAAVGGISTTTIGFGADYDEHLLRSLAEAGGGSMYYIEEPDQAPPVFETELEGLMALAAQNVAVTVRPGGAVDVAAVHHAYPRRETDDGALRLELGDLYALEPKSLLIEFRVHDDGASLIDVAELVLQAHVLRPGGAVEKRTVELPITVDRDRGPVVNPVVRRELLLLEAARAREAALEDRAMGRYDDGARKLRRVAEKLAPGAGSDPELRDEVDDLRDLAARFEDEQVSAADAKYMHQRAYSRSSSKLAAMDAVRRKRARDRRRDEEG